MSRVLYHIMVTVKITQRMRAVLFSHKESYNISHVMIDLANYSQQNYQEE